MKKYFLHFLNLSGTILKYALIVALALIILIIILLSSAYRDLKTAGLSSWQAKNNLSAALAAVQSRNWSEALNQNLDAQANITIARSALNRIHNNPAVKKVGLIKIQINDLGYLLETAEILSRSLERVVPLVQEGERIYSGSAGANFISLSSADKNRLLKLLYESEPELTGLKANIDLALLNLNRIHKIGILWPAYKEISQVKEELNQASLLMAQALPLTKLLPALAGYPDASNFLIILQNNDELRPTGGFIGVYALLESHGGEVITLKTDDSYHLDMPASLSSHWNLEPPAPLKKYLKVQKWYLRDANWSPDWPTAARQINQIYQGENQALGQPQPELTGIIAINPDLVSDLISLVGPITIRGETYTADNLQTLLQYNVEVAYKEQAIAAWDRKDIINELVAELKNRLFNLSATQWPELLKIIEKNITNRNFQIYFANSTWQSLAQTLGASGEVKDTGGDYLMIVDSNFGAFKSDLVVKKGFSYYLKENSQNLQAIVKLNYRHEGGFDWRTTRYRSYTRVYTPLGSELVSLEGIEKEAADLNIVNDVTLNKTVFGFFLTVEPGATQNITLNYRLPGNIYQQLLSKDYQLLVQKQSGQRVESLKVTYQPKKGKAKEWLSEFKTDKIFTLTK